MTGDLPGFSAEQWAVFKQSGCRGTDFDWFALDRKGHLAVFTTARVGPVPMTIWDHYDDFMRLRQWVAELPALAPAIQVFPDPGNYRDWSEYALKGLFAFDFHDETGNKAAQGYHLIAQPLAPLREAETGVSHMAHWLPVLDADFSSATFVSDALLLPYGMHM